MPNHCENRTTIWGSPSQVAEVIKQMITSDKEDGFALSNLVPMPEGLKNTEASFVDAEIPAQWAKHLADGKWTQAEYDEAVARNREQWEAKAARISEYGYGDWYEWACDDENWGTKWGDYSHSGDLPNILELESSIEGKVGVEFTYDTAWSPFSDRFWERASGRFPEVRFETRYQELGMCFAGVTIAYKGVVVGESTDDLPEIDWDSENGSEEFYEKLEALHDHLYDLADLKLAYTGLIKS